MKIQLANPRGFCAGVDRAIEIVDRALDAFGAPIYVRHEVVHNRFVVETLRKRGAVFVDELDEVPDDGIVIFSAHGVSKQVQEEAERRGLRVFDATCPLVTKVHIGVAKFGDDGREVILIGHKGHPEVEGTMGQYRGKGQESGIYLVETTEDVTQLEVHNPDALAFVTQTTLSMDDATIIINALKQRFPTIHGPKRNDICYATQNRQDAVKELAAHNEVVLVVGSPNSSNSNRLREIAEHHGATAYLVDGPEDLDKTWFGNGVGIGITAGASAPEILVKRIIDQLQEWGVEQVNEGSGIEENVSFILPKELQQVIENKGALPKTS